MKNLLYIGNKLVSDNTNITTIDSLGGLLIAEGYQVRFASEKHNKIFRLLDMLMAVIKNRRNTDYVLIDTYSTLNFQYALLISQLCRILRLKYIPILHGGDLPSRLKNSPKKSRLLFDNAYRNVSPSHYIKHRFEELGFDNIDHIPNSIQIKDYPYQKREKVQAKLLWVRSFKDIYNPLMAITVTNRMIEEGISASLCMVGPDGDGSFMFANKLARESDLKVHFTGKLSREEWTGLSKDYDIFINTSRFDNMPVSIIEAMALGLPIVTTNVGGIPSIVTNDKDAILVGDNDIEGMTSAISKLLNNPSKVVQLSMNARHTAEKFDWNIVKMKWRDLLK